MVGASNASTIHVTDEVAMAPLDHVDISKEIHSNSYYKIKTIIEKMGRRNKNIICSKVLNFTSLS